MEKHIIMIDLDGTLLNNHSQISDLNKRILHEVKNQGHEIIITTGRAYYRSHMFYEDLSLKSLIVNRNACIIHSPHDLEFKNILEWIDEKTVDNILTGEISQLMNKMYLEHLNDVYVIKGDTNFYQPYPLCQLINYENQFLSKETTLIAILVENKDVNRMKDLLDKLPLIKYEKYLMSEELSLFNIYPIKSDKANSFTYLSEYYKVPLKRIIALGDGGNDVRMVKEAGVGVAMKNAIDVVKENAKIITDYSNDDSGVGLFLRDYFNLNV